MTEEVLVSIAKKTEMPLESVPRLVRFWLSAVSFAVLPRMIVVCRGMGERCVQCVETHQTIPEHGLLVQSSWS